VTKAVSEMGANRAEIEADRNESGISTSRRMESEWTDGKVIRALSTTCSCSCSAPLCSRVLLVTETSQFQLLPEFEFVRYINSVIIIIILF